MRKYFLIFLSLVLFVMLAFAGNRVLAMSSENYQIDKDSINFGGSEDGGSANYSLRDTLGELGTGDGESANYNLSAGYRTSDNEIPTLAFSISSNSVNLGVLSVSSVSMGSIVATTTTNALSGYNISVIEDGNFRAPSGSVINDVADGAVSSGSSEYGLRTSGIQGLYNSSDTNITGSLKPIASSNGPALNNSVTVIFKAAISPSTTAGQYQNKVTFICTGAF